METAQNIKSELLEELDYVLAQTTGLAHRNPRSTKALRKLIQCTLKEAKEILSTWFEDYRVSEINTMEYAKDLILRFPFKELKEVPFIDLEW